MAVRRIRTPGRSESETEEAAPAAPDDAPAPRGDPARGDPARVAREEADRIAERLAELVEARRRASAEAQAAASETHAAPPETPVLDAGTRPAEGPDAGARQVVGARHSGRLLGNLLVARGYMVDTELQHALAKQNRDGGAIGRIVVELGYITERDLVEILAEQLRMPVVDPTRTHTDAEVVALLPVAAARRLGAIPLRREDERIVVAIADPTDDASVAELTAGLGGSLRLMLAARADVDAALDRFYG